eukprot:TRINITY_DN7552_c0_g1_i7.p1 TRINITY_DN7552_c0_g1~~TRINITY_DN7552_c0_g1_i7.p1  ORF type:complete len:1123 (-),score=283.69 TRINITY_DN7552_c0_g1_i7:91-3351(-)
MYKEPSGLAFRRQRAVRRQSQMPQLRKKLKKRRKKDGKTHALLFQNARFVVKEEAHAKASKRPSAVEKILSSSPVAPPAPLPCSPLPPSERLAGGLQAREQLAPWQGRGPTCIVPKGLRCVPLQLPPKAGQAFRGTDARIVAGPAWQKKVGMHFELDALLTSTVAKEQKFQVRRLDRLTEQRSLCISPPQRHETEQFPWLLSPSCQPPPLPLSDGSSPCSGVEPEEELWPASEGLQEPEQEELSTIRGEEEEKRDHEENDGAEVETEELAEHDVHGSAASMRVSLPHPGDVGLLEPSSSNTGIPVPQDSSVKAPQAMAEMRVLPPKPEHAPMMPLAHLQQVSESGVEHDQNDSDAGGSELESEDKEEMEASAEVPEQDSEDSEVPWCTPSRPAWAERDPSPVEPSERLGSVDERLTIFSKLEDKDIMEMEASAEVPEQDSEVPWCTCSRPADSVLSRDPSPGHRQDGLDEQLTVFSKLKDEDMIEMESSAEAPEQDSQVPWCTPSRPADAVAVSSRDPSPGHRQDGLNELLTVFSKLKDADIMDMEASTEVPQLDSQVPWHTRSRPGSANTVAVLSRDPSPVEPVERSGHREDVLDELLKVFSKIEDEDIMEMEASAEVPEQDTEVPWCTPSGPGPADAVVPLSRDPSPWHREDGLDELLTGFSKLVDEDIIEMEASAEVPEQHSQVQWCTRSRPGSADTVVALSRGPSPVEPFERSGHREDGLDEMLTVFSKLKDEDIIEMESSTEVPQLDSQVPWCAPSGPGPANAMVVLSRDPSPGHCEDSLDEMLTVFSKLKDQDIMEREASTEVPQLDSQVPWCAPSRPGSADTVAVLSRDPSPVEHVQLVEAHSGRLAHAPPQTPLLVPLPVMAEMPVLTTMQPALLQRVGAADASNHCHETADELCTTMEVLSEERDAGGSIEVQHENVEEETSSELRKVRTEEAQLVEVKVDTPESEEEEEQTQQLVDDEIDEEQLQTKQAGALEEQAKQVEEEEEQTEEVVVLLIEPDEADEEAKDDKGEKVEDEGEMEEREHVATKAEVKDTWQTEDTTELEAVVVTIQNGEDEVEEDKSSREQEHVALSILFGGH